jgi:hypothetical protein
MGRVTTLSSIAVAYVTGPKYCVSFDDPEQVCDRQRDTGSCGSLVLLVRPRATIFRASSSNGRCNALRLIPWPVFGAIFDAKDHGGLMSVHPDADAAQILDPMRGSRRVSSLRRSLLMPARQYREGCRAIDARVRDRRPERCATPGRVGGGSVAKPA